MWQTPHWNQSLRENRKRQVHKFEVEQKCCWMCIQSTWYTVHCKIYKRHFPLMFTDEHKICSKTRHHGNGRLPPPSHIATMMGSTQILEKNRDHLLGIVVTTSPTCSRYRMVVLPAPSSPKISTRNSFDPHSPENNRVKMPPGCSPCVCLCGGTKAP